MRIVFFLKNLQEELKIMSQGRDDLVSKVESFENQLNVAAEENAAIYKEFSDTKEELQSVMGQLSELKENLQVEQKEKEVSMELLLSKCVYAVPLKKGCFLQRN